MREIKLSTHDILRYFIYFPITVIVAGGAGVLIGIGIWLGAISLASFIHYFFGIDHLFNLTNTWGLAFFLVGGAVFGIGVAITIFNKGVF